MTNWWRRLGAPGVIASAIALVVLAASVARLPGSSLLPSLPGLHEPDYSQETRTHLAPLRRDFVAERLGATVLARITTASSDHAAATPVAARQPSQPRSNKTTGTTAPATAANKNIISSALAPGAWDLRLEFASDSPAVAPGGDITYTLTVLNVGRSAFSGRLDLRSHVPLFTSHVSDPVCALETLAQLVANQTEGCPLPSLPLPAQYQDVEVAGQPVPLSGLTWTTQAVIPAGGAAVRKFSVTVNPGADGRDIVNHAHISVLGAASQRSSDVVVHVPSRLSAPPS